MDFNLAEDSIFMGNIQVARQQIDCIRFSYITPSSRTPCHYQCQPDLVEQLVTDQADKESERLRVQSVFNSTQYGKPTYVQLTHACAEELTAVRRMNRKWVCSTIFTNPSGEANLRARVYR
jgi:hypothetical protein